MLMQYLYLRERELVLSYDGKFYPHMQFFVNSEGQLERKSINQILDENEQLKTDIKAMFAKIVPMVMDIDFSTELVFSGTRYDFDIIHLNVNDPEQTAVGKFPRMMLIKLLERPPVFKQRKGGKKVQMAKEYPLTNLVRVNGAHKANCPLQKKDTTPSFHVYPNNTWYCFSCNQGGDVIDFVMKKDNLDFMGAVNKLIGV